MGSDNSTRNKRSHQPTKPERGKILRALGQKVGTGLVLLSTFLRKYKSSKIILLCLVLIGVGGGGFFAWQALAHHPVTGDLLPIFIDSSPLAELAAQRSDNPTPVANEGIVAREIKGGRSILRAQPALSAIEVESLSAGTRVIILDETNAWYFVRVTEDAKEGYLYKGSVVSTRNNFAIGVQKNRGTSVFIYAGLAADNLIVDVVQDSLLVVHGWNGEWLEVLTAEDAAGGRKGWIQLEDFQILYPPNSLESQLGINPRGILPQSTSYTTIQIPKSPDSGVIALNPTRGSYVVLHAEANLQSESVAKVSLGSEVIILSETHAWFGVKLVNTGQQGYLYKGSVLSARNRYYIAWPTQGDNPVQIRGGPGEEFQIVDTTKGDPLVITGEQGDWFSVLTAEDGSNGREGWVRKTDYCVIYHPLS